MAKFIVRRVILMFVTMLVGSMLIFAVCEAAPGNIARNILGAFAGPEQEASLRAQLGLDRPIYVRYAAW
jgi:peptide/nickel transport system permease protein